MSAPGGSNSRGFLYASYTLIGAGVIALFFLSIAIGLILIIIGVGMYAYNRRLFRRTQQGGGGTGSTTGLSYPPSRTPHPAWVIR